MSATFERCFEKFLHYLAGLICGDETPRHDEYIGIVMLTGEVGYLGLPHQGCTNMLMLIQCHRYALATATNSDASLTLPGTDAVSQGMGIVGIVATLLGEAPIILVGFSYCGEIFFHEGFQGETGMVTC